MKKLIKYIILFILILICVILLPVGLKLNPVPAQSVEISNVRDLENVDILILAEFGSIQSDGSRKDNVEVYGIYEDKFSIWKTAIMPLAGLKIGWPPEIKYRYSKHKVYLFIPHTSFNALPPFAYEEGLWEIDRKNGTIINRIPYFDIKKENGVKHITRNPGYNTIDQNLDWMTIRPVLINAKNQIELLNKRFSVYYKYPWQVNFKK